MGKARIYLSGNGVRAGFDDAFLGTGHINGAMVADLYVCGD